MTTVRFGSCDAEQQWRPADLAAVPAVRDVHAERLYRAMDELQAVLCAPGDVLLTDRPPRPAFTQLMAAAGFGGRHVAVPGGSGDRGDQGGPGPRVEARLAALAPADPADPADPGGLPGLAGAFAAPYAVVPGTAAAMARLGTAGAPPTVDAVRLVNSKSWSTGLGLPGAGTIVTSLSELRAAAGTPCVVKDPYGVSGQGNIVIDSPARLDLIERHLSRSGGRIELIVQPLFNRDNDFAAHLSVAPDGRISWHGIRQVHNEGHSYRGSTGPTPGLLALLERAGYRETVETVAAHAAAAGYHGPLSVDSMTTLEGDLIPVLEVNARQSPGMIAQLLGARLQLRVVPVRDEGAFERIVHRLEEISLLETGDRDGVLPLAAGTLAPPRGWFFYAVFGAKEVDLDPVLHDVL